MSLACYIWVDACSRLSFEMLPEICGARKEAEDGFSLGMLTCLTDVACYAEQCGFTNTSALVALTCLTHVLLISIA